MENSDTLARALLVIGSLLFLSLGADYLRQRVPIPRVTILLLFGLLIGPTGFDLLPDDHSTWSPLITHVALVMIGFLLGSEFRARHLQEHGLRIVVVAFVQAGVTAVVVGSGLLVLGASRPTALALAGIACATAPAATVAVIQEAGDEGGFARTLLGVVAIDDVIALVLFSILLTVAVGPTASTTGWLVLVEALREVGGGVGLGALLGLPLAYLTGRLKPGQATTLEALGAVSLATGAALALGVSPLLTAMSMGAVVANFARHHERAFHEIENLEVPFLALFFLLAGASLRLEALFDIGIVGAGFVLLRIVGKVGGGFVGGRLSGLSNRSSLWLGAALLPQAGVALGLALTSADRLLEEAGSIVTVAIIATVVFELVGPPLTRLALSLQGRAAP